MPKSWDIEMIVDKINTEGLDYMIRDYLSHSDIEDPELAELWEAAADALNALDDYISEQAEEQGLEYL